MMGFGVNLRRLLYKSHSQVTAPTAKMTGIMVAGEITGDCCFRETDRGAVTIDEIDMLIRNFHRQIADRARDGAARAMATRYKPSFSIPGTGNRSLRGR